MYEPLTRWEIFKSLFVKRPRLVYLAVAKKTSDDIIADIRDKSGREVDKLLYSNKELSTKYEVVKNKFDICKKDMKDTNDQLSSSRKSVISLTDKVHELGETLVTYKSDIDEYIKKNKELTNKLTKRTSEYDNAQVKIKKLEDKLKKCIDSNSGKGTTLKDAVGTFPKSTKKKALTKKDVLAIREAKSSEVKKLANKHGLTIEKIKDIKDKKLYKKW